MPDRLRLSPRYRRVLKTLLREHLPDTEVWAYGSRVNGRGHDGSDLDLVLRAPHLEKIPIEKLMDFEEGVRESTIPILVEARDWARLPERFRREIEREYVVVSEGRKEPRLNWPRSCIGDLVTVHKERITPSSFHDDLFAHYSIPAYDARQVPSVESGSQIKSNKFTVPSDAVLVSRLNPRFPRVWSPDIVDDEPAICSTEFLVLCPGRLIDRRFLHHLCMNPHFRASLLERVTGTSGSHQRVSPQSVLEIEVSVPPLPEQCAIAHTLGTFDDKIELNHRMNKTLEAMAQALFKSWFVDFAPVRAKMEGRETGLPQDIADLFPDRLVDSEMGEIPEGWAVYRLDQLTHHHTNSTSPFRSPELQYEHFSIPAYDAGQHPAVEPGAAIRSNKTVVPDGAVLLSKLNPRIARVWVPPESMGRPQVCSTEFLVFTPKPPANRSLLFALFADQHFRALLNSFVTGTSKSHQRVPPRALKSHDVLAGWPRLFAVFGEATGDILAQVLKNRSEAATLATLRDTLLPKLISGEIRLEEAASIAGEVP